VAAVSRRGWVLFTLMSVIWGMPYLFIKVADGGVSVPVLVFARVTIAASLLLPLALHRRGFGGLWRHWRWLLAFALVEMIAPWALLSNAERQLTSSMSGLLIASVPIITVVLARLTGGTERLTVTRWAGLVIGLAGVAVLAGRGALGGDTWSVAQVMLVAVCYSTGPLIANRKLADLPVLAVNAFCLSFAALLYAPAAALTWPSAVPSAQVLASLAALGVICTALAFVLFLQLIAEAGPARAMVFTYVNPAVAVALGVAVLGEPLTPEMVAAFVLILAGSVLATRPGRPAPLAVAEGAQPEPGGDTHPEPGKGTHPQPGKGTHPQPAGGVQALPGQGTAAAAASASAGTGENAPAGEAAPG
jgi:drug/metabolite transporter (DMT)-like permease